MKKTIVIIFCVVIILALYKKQHIQPVEDPEDSPIFQERLKSSMDRFQEDEIPGGQNIMRSGQNPAGNISPSPRAVAGSKDLAGAGRCGRVTLTWVEETPVDKSAIEVKRRVKGGEYAVLRGSMIYDRVEGDGTRYWITDEGLKDGSEYEYVISCGGEKGKEKVKGPALINLTCTEQDREMLARREKQIKEYYEKRGISAPESSSASNPPAYELSKEVYDVNTGSSPQKGGGKDSRVTMVVFTDFECVHCGTWAQTLEEMIKTFPGEIRVVFKNFPLLYHKQSELAALAALAAGEQGRFWEMHNMLFKDQNSISMDNILGYAGKLKLDISRFRESLESKELKGLIDQDKAQGTVLGVNNIPTTFINGKKLVGSPPFDRIKEIIESIVKEKR